MLEHRYGPVSFTEWRGLWKHSPLDTDIGYDEFYSAYKLLAEFLERRYDGEDQSLVPVCRGDCFGDRTQTVDIASGDFFNKELLLGLQAFLHQNNLINWRISVPFDNPFEGAVFIYPTCIRWGIAIESQLIEQAVAKIRFEMT